MAAQKKKGTAKKNTSAVRQKAKEHPANNSRKQTSYVKRQTAAVILFALALFLLCVAVIPGGDTFNAWSALHMAVLGTFGLCAFALPILLGFIAISMAKSEENKPMLRRVWQSGLCFLLLGAVLQVFTVDLADAPAYTAAVSSAFSKGAALFEDGTVNGGALGAIIGYPLECWFGDIGAKIILCLLLFVVLMLMTGATLLSLWKPVKKTAEYTRERINDKNRRALEEAEEENRAAEKLSAADKKNTSKASAGIDIDMGEGYAKEEASRDPKEAFTLAAEQLKAEEEKPELKVEDIIGRAIKQPDDPSPSKDDEKTKKKMTQAQLRQQEELIAQEVNAEQSAEPAESYTYPPISLLDKAPAGNDDSAREEMQVNAKLLVQTLKEFGISTKVVDIARGPSVTRYELQPNAGVKISRITGLADDIALRLATTGVRIEAPIPNKAAVGIEVPNKASSMVCLRELIDSDEFSSQSGPLTVALGRDISGRIITADLAKMPHLLIAGTTGSGKSVCTNSMIQSVLYRSSPEDVKMILIDPKQVEFGIYNGIPHLLVPVVTDPRKAAGALGWAVTEMLNRYKIFAENNVRDIKSYNTLAKTSDTLQTMPLILIVIDELSDLMMAAGKEVEDAIVRLAQMARAAGMHLVIATQRPSVDVITGLIKANIPSRLALTVASAVDSRTILDASGAEKLLGKGDMLFHPVGLPKPLRVQGCFVSDHEVESVVNFLKSSSSAEYDESVVDEINRQAEAAEKADAKGESGEQEDGDEMLPQAIEVVVEAGQASTSLLQRRLRLGYARAGRIIDEMEQRGIVGPHEGSKPRKVLITRQQWLEMQVTKPEDDAEES